MTRLVALSTSYGALGSLIGPEVADRLGVPFVDRAIPLAVAQRLDVPVSEADADEGRPNQGWLERMLLAFEFAGPLTGPAPIPIGGTPDQFRLATEEAIREQAATGAGVILGRGSVLVLRGDPRVLRVRLDGPRTARIRQAMELFALDERTATQTLEKVDRVRSDYMRRLYLADISDPRLVHLTIDSTALPREAVVELIVTAAKALPG